MTEQRKKVLVVEDDEAIREIILLALARLDVDLLHARDGDEAVSMALQETPDLITLDVGLPEKSGLDVCRILRATPATARIKILMLSAHGTPADRKAGLDAGADLYMTKPFLPQELVACVKEFLDNPGPG